MLPDFRNGSVSRHRGTENDRVLLSVQEVGSAPVRGQHGASPLVPGLEQSIARHLPPLKVSSLSRHAYARRRRGVDRLAAGEAPSSRRLVSSISH